MKISIKKLDELAGKLRGDLSDNKKLLIKNNYIEKRNGEFYLTKSGKVLKTLINRRKK